MAPLDSSFRGRLKDLRHAAAPHGRAARDLRCEKALARARRTEAALDFLDHVEALVLLWMNEFRLAHPAFELRRSLREGGYRFALHRDGEEGASFSRLEFLLHLRATDGAFELLCRSVACGRSLEPARLRAARNFRGLVHLRRFLADRILAFARAYAGPRPLDAARVA